MNFHRRYLAALTAGAAGAVGVEAVARAPAAGDCLRDDRS